MAEPVEPQAGYQQWLDALPEGMADTPTADALRAACDLDVSDPEIAPSRPLTGLRSLLEASEQTCGRASKI